MEHQSGHHRGDAWRRGQDGDQRQRSFGGRVHMRDVQAERALRQGQDGGHAQRDAKEDEDLAPELCASGSRLGDPSRLSLSLRLS